MAGPYSARRSMWNAVVAKAVTGKPLSHSSTSGSSSMSHTHDIINDIAVRATSLKGGGTSRGLWSKLFGAKR